MAALEPLIMPKIERLLPDPPVDWPWALPHLYSVETVSEPGADVVGYSACKDGTGTAKIEAVRDRTRVNVIGYWDSNYAVVWSRLFLTKADAKRKADIHFKIKPIRYRAEDGRVLRVNESIDITGNWPASWTFDRFWDLGAFCAFLYAGARAAGRDQDAEAFKASLHQAMPGSDTAMMFHDALSKARKSFGLMLDSKTQAALDIAIDKCGRRTGRPDVEKP